MSSFSAISAHEGAFFRKRAGGLLLFCFLFSTIFSSCAPAQAQTCDPQADHSKSGETQIEQGKYDGAVMDFTCAIKKNPLDLDAYRGRIDALLLSGKYSDALHNYTEISIKVLPKVPNAIDQIMAVYQTALQSDPKNIRLLTGHSFSLWRIYEDDAALAEVEQILKLQPDNLYGTVFHGSLMFFAKDQAAGERDFKHAFELEPKSADIYFIQADGYTYGLNEFEQALVAVKKANELGLDTARVNAIFATAYFNLGNEEKAIPYFAKHIERATVETVKSDPLEPGKSVTINIMPGQTYSFPVEVKAGETLDLTTTSKDAVDSIMILLASDGSLITGNDDSVEFNAGFERVISEAGTYNLLMTSFEGAGSGEIVLSRK